jgi:hypothetical protein
MSGTKPVVSEVFPRGDVPVATIERAFEGLAFRLVGRDLFGSIFYVALSAPRSTGTDDRKSE